MLSSKHRRVAYFDKELRSSGRNFDVADLESRKGKSDEGPFGPSGAAGYDIDASIMPRRYKSAHRIQNQLVRQALALSAAPHPVVIDLGCGTGNDGLQILQHATTAIYVGVDLSRHMLARAATKLRRAGFENRSILLRRDFRWLTSDDLSNSVGGLPLQGGAACVISALALHHYQLAEKKGVYALAHSMLSTGGLFLATDLFSNAIALCAQLALQQEVASIRKAIKRLTLSSTDRLATTVSERHYTNENRPQAIMHEIRLLADVGFNKIDVTYRNGQLGVIAAER